MSNEILRVEKQSKASQLTQILLDEILRQNVQPGEKLWTESELIQTYGVSVATVRKVLGDLSSQGITERRVAKGTFLKSFPETTRKTSQPVVMMSWMSEASLAKDLYFGPIYASIEETLHAADRRFYLMSGKWGRYPVEELQDVRSANPAAIILPFGMDTQKLFIAQLITLGVPLVLLGSPLSGAKAVQIHFDDYAGGVMAAEYLLKKGYRRFGIIGGAKGSPAGEHRTEAFKHVILRSPDATIVNHLTPEGYDQLHGYEQAKLLFSEYQNDMDVVFCAGDLLALGAMKYIETSGLRIPQDIAVMGYGQFDIPTESQRSLTTVRMDLDQMGKCAAETTLSLIENDPVPTEEKFVCLPVSLIEGQTA